MNVRYNFLNDIIWDICFESAVLLSSSEFDKMFKFCFAWQGKQNSEDKPES